MFAWQRSKEPAEDITEVMTSATEHICVESPPNLREGYLPPPRSPSFVKRSAR